MRTLEIEGEKATEWMEARTEEVSLTTVCRHRTIPQDGDKWGGLNENGLRGLAYLNVWFPGGELLRKDKVQPCQRR